MNTRNRETQEKTRRLRVAALRLLLFFWLLSSVLGSFAAGRQLADASKLPPPANSVADFDRDIWPILDMSCLRCHGREKPKSGFRLDSREAALRGGENGVAIVPGDSAKSPLIHYVARLVEEMEMPPAGKGDPLTREEVAMLRAWIDQGAKWGAGALSGEPSLMVTPTLRYLTIRGDERKFRELNWQKGGWSGGIEAFESHQRDNDTDVTLRGHVLWDENNYGLSFDVRRPDVGFIRGGVEQYRKYFDDSGGYFAGTQLSLSRDLHLDIGKAWIDFGLSLPGWPKFGVGYEYQWRDGEKSTLQWGPVTVGGDTRNISPTAKAVREHVHTVKFDLDHTVAGWRLEDNFRGEFYDLKTTRPDLPAYRQDNPAVVSAITVREGERSFTGANTLQAEKQLAEWLFASGGYLYSKLNADASFGLEGELSPPGAIQEWRSREIVLERESHVFNLNGVLGPWQGFTLALGGQGEWTRQQGMGGFNIEAVRMPTNIPLGAVSLNSDLDTARLSESALLRFTRIPFTTVFAEARLDQESISQYEDQGGSPAAFVRNTDATSDARDLRAGFSTSPWKQLTWSGHYRRQERDSRYDHRVDSDPISYSAFILSRRILTDEFETKLALRPVSWLRASLGYKLQATDYHTETPSLGGPLTGGEILAGNYDAHVWSLNLVCTAIRNLYLSTTFSYQRARTVTLEPNDPVVASYRGDIYSVLATANYTVNAKTDLFAGYNFSTADFAQANSAAGLPLGTDYAQHAAQVGVGWKMTRNIKARIGCALFRYDEPSAGGLDNYTAHMIFASMICRLP